MYLILISFFGWTPGSISHISLFTFYVKSFLFKGKEKERKEVMVVICPIELIDSPHVSCQFMLFFFFPPVKFTQKFI